MNLNTADKWGPCFVGLEELMGVSEREPFCISVSTTAKAPLR